MKKQRKEQSIPVSNRFELLTNRSDQVEDSTDSEKDETATNPTVETKIKIKKPPPLVLHDKVEVHHEFITKLKQIINTKFHVKYHKEFTEIFTTDMKDYEKLKRNWQQNKLQFHTYTDKTVKKRAFVIRGLHRTMNISELIAELTSLDINVIALNIMRNTVKLMYMLTTDTVVTVK